MKRFIPICFSILLFGSQYASAQKQIIVNGSLKCATDVNFTNEACFTINNTLVLTKIKDGIWKSNYNGWDLYIKDENIQGFLSPKEVFKNSTRKVFITDPIICYTDIDFTHTDLLLIHNDSITIKRYDNTHWETVYRGAIVYIPEDNIQDIQSEKRIENIKKEKKARLVKRNLLIKKYGKKLGTFISDGYIRRGMTKAQAKLSWGEPNKVHRTVFSGGVHEQWVYGSSQYLYFENGILSAWQD